MADNSLYGGERQDVQDPLTPRRGAPAQPNQIPLSGVQAPRRADFSQVGEGQRVIAKLLGESSNMLQQYVEQNRQQWELDGKMAYAQGTAEDEIRKTGNKYTMAGFLTMKTQVAATQFYQSELEDIDNKYRDTDPETYRADLSNRFKQVSDSLGTDPYVQRLLGAGAAEYFPKLVAQQVKSNNAWRQQETFDGSVQNMIAGGTLKDPQNPNGGKTAVELRQLISDSTAPLHNPDDKRKAVAQAVQLTLKSGDRRLFDAVAGADQEAGSGVSVKDLPPIKQIQSQAIDYVMSIEGGFVPNDSGKGPTKFGINKTANPDVDVVNLTPDQARKIYEERYWKPVITEDMAPDMQLAAFDAAVNQGVGWTQGAIKASGGDVDKFLALRRQRYIDIAQADPTKAQFLDGWLARLDKLTGASMAGRPLSNTVQNLVSEKKAIVQLAANGFSPAQINEIQSSYTSYMNEQDSQFDKNRYINEQSILNTAAQEGNLPAQLDRIQQVGTQYGYSQKWQNQMAEKVAKQVEDFNKKNKEYVEVDNLGTAGMLSTASGEKQKVGIDRERARIIGTWQAKPGMTDDQKNQGIRQDMTDFLVRNGVVDDTWKKSIAAGLTGDIINKKTGNLNPAALRAYQDYQYLKNNSPLGYAQQYIPADQKKLIAMAESLDVRMNSDQALITAANTLGTQESLGIKPKVVAQPDVEKIIEKKVEDELNPGIFSFISRFQAADALDVKDSDVAAWKANPVLKAALMAQTNTILASDPTGRTTVEAAANEAWNNIVTRAEMAPGGNVLMSGSGNTIRQDLGYPNASATNLLFKAWQQYGELHGKEIFGPRYHGRTASDSADSQLAAYKARTGADTSGKDERWMYGKIRDEVAGFPPSTIVYDPDRKVFLWTLTKEGEDGTQVPDGATEVIPASVFTAFMKNQQYTERSHRNLTEWAKDTAQNLKTQIVGKD